jgi:hypothetical protein
VLVQTIHRQTEAERKREFRSRQGDDFRRKDSARKRATRAAAIPEFIAVDSEGITSKRYGHRAVLVGVGEIQRVARDTNRGLQWKETFEFLYECFKLNPRAAYVGFYLSYDFNQWLRSLPADKAWYLISKAGRASRRMTDRSAKRRMYHPVRVDGWEIDMLGFKRLSIRPRHPDCQCPENKIKGCKHQEGIPWMHICDAGPFYQMSFLKVCDPAKWEHDPEGPICTDAEYADLKRGKDKRATAKLDEEMKHYNRLENILLARCMRRLAGGFASIGVRLAKDKWYGPGSSASAWLRNHQAVKRRDTEQMMPEWFRLACRNSYFGGWFEIFSHGLIKGVSHNYDINNAYPYATSKLPHICSACTYTRGNGVYKGSGDYVLVLATVRAKGTRIGPVPYRDSKGSILRPSASRGWYWRGEIEAATRAGLVHKGKTEYHEWVEFTPCNSETPFEEVRELYQRRLDVGKNSAQGMSIKLNNNSLYGKWAQSTGEAPYNNWLYASYITSHCRIQILDAIATHPGGANSVLMVATDGILFDSPHPTLPVSSALGDWEHTEYTDVCLFKPGVYWHKEGKDQLVKTKSRGVPKEEFQLVMGDAEYHFRKFVELKTVPGDPRVSVDIVAEDGELWARLEGCQEWPWVKVHIKFRMKSCAQAINEGHWERAAQVQTDYPLIQSSDPHEKRTGVYYNERKKRLDSVMHALPVGEIQTKYYQEVVADDDPDIGFDFDGDASNQFQTTLSIVRDNDNPAVYPQRRQGFNPDDFQWERLWG